MFQAAQVTKNGVLQLHGKSYNWSDICGKETKVWTLVLFTLFYVNVVADKAFAVVVTACITFINKIDQCKKYR